MKIPNRLTAATRKVSNPRKNHSRNPWIASTNDIHLAEFELIGDLAVPRDALGVIVFAHGSGSGRRSPRNRSVASRLHAAGFATLLFDLLTLDEEGDRGNVFDISLLGRRLIETTRWIRRQH